MPLNRRAPTLAPARKLTLAEQIEGTIDRAYELLQIANDDRRNPGRSNELLDGLADLGRTYHRLGRG